MITTDVVRLGLILAAAVACEAASPRATRPATSVATQSAPKRDISVAGSGGAATQLGRSHSVEIAAVGPYLPYDATAQDERNPAWWRQQRYEEWRALCERGGIVELVPANMTVSPAEVEGDKNGLLVSAAECPDAVTLIRGLSRNSGVVPTAAVARKAVPSSRAQDTTWELRLLGLTWRLYFQDSVGLPLMVSIDGYTQEVRNWKDVASRVAEPGSNRHDWGFAGGIKVLWGGDLNGDGLLDLLLKQGDAEIGSSIELFLSSGSSSAPLITVADIFALGAC
jgi:hypothetical protein